MTPQWPADKVERWPIDKLMPYARNPRTHSAAQVDQIARAIEQFGWTTPVLCDEHGTLIAGHGRIMAAQKLGLPTIPVITARGWTEAQKRAYVIWDNQSALLAGWDEDLLRTELADLELAQFDMSLTGFNGDELAAFLRDPNVRDPEATTEPPAVPVSRRGDLWLCGDHRLLCGDCTVKDDVARVMADADVDLCFTSPPYAQQRDYVGNIGDWDALMQGMCSAIRMGAAGQLLVNLGLVHRNNEWDPYWDPWITWMREQGWRRFGWYVWDQGPGLPGDWRGRLAPSHEFIFHFNRQAERARKSKAKKPESIQFNDHGNGMRKRNGKMSGVSSPEKSLQPNKIADSVIRVMRHKARGPEISHPAVFPTQLSREIIEAFSDNGDFIYEPFCGSGSQMIAAEMTGRRCLGIEIEPTYVDVAVRRWQDYAGRKATLDATGQTFEQINNERIVG